MKICDPSATLIWHTPSALYQIEEAGRTAYRSECHDPDGFVQMIITRGHESVLEHAVASFRIICDRGVSHEIVRHRLASYTQESTRYCRYNDEIEVIRPMEMDYDAWEASTLNAERAYLAALERGESPQVARYLLPLCLKTELVMTANFREWRHFLRLRCHKSAHPHIRRIAGQIKDQLPNVIVEDL